MTGLLSCSNMRRFTARLNGLCTMTFPLSFIPGIRWPKALGWSGEHQKRAAAGHFPLFPQRGCLAEKRPGEIVDLGFYLGIGGVLTYKNAGLAEALADIDLANMVLETDAPYLSPVPFRGKRNESAYLTYVAARLAGVKGVPVETVARVTTENAQKIFGH